MMKKTFLILFLSAILSLPILVLADGIITIDNPLNATSFEAIINSVTNFIFWIAMVIAPVMALIAGFYFVTAAGDPKRVATAKNILIYAAIGLAIILLAKGLVSILRGILGG